MQRYRSKVIIKPDSNQTPPAKTGKKYFKLALEKKEHTPIVKSIPFSLPDSKFAEK
jgi:hypothetical protein